jgi:peptidoglycan hydrolase-like protein with peptidoglycan-binding domain
VTAAIATATTVLAGLTERIGTSESQLRLVLQPPGQHGLVKGKGTMTIFYPDVSSFQAGVSFSGVPIAMVKATEGTGYTNPDYSPAKIRAKDAGAFFCAYHFLQQGNGAAQADHAFSVADSTPLMLDVETETLNGVTSTPSVTDVVDFVSQYRALGGVLYLLYLPRWYWADLGSPSLAPLIELGLLLVSSDYTSYSDSGPGWDSYGGMTPVIWQYTDTATLNGVVGVDFNAYQGTVADFESQVTTGALPGTNPTLQEGDTGPAVETLQTRLNAWGATLAVNGDFGPDTLAAVKAFQAGHALSVDGIVGPLTWAALNESPSGQPYPAPASVAAGSVSLSVTWATVEVSRKAVESYTVQAVGLNGQVFATETPTATSAVLSGLVRGSTYNILVSANGGPVAPQQASIKVTL